MAFAIPEQFIPKNMRKWTSNSYLKCQNFIPYATSVIGKNPMVGLILP